MTDIEILIITYGEQTRWAGYYSEGVEADIKNEEAISTLTKLKAEIDRLNAEWMAKCEELRKDSERYRRIRLGLSNVHGDVYAMVFAGDGDYPEDGDALDRAVDASLAKKEGA